MNESEAEGIRVLGEILREFDLDAIRVKLGAAEVELVRREPSAVAPAAAAAPAPALPAAADPVAADAVAAAPAGIRKVTAPVVGVFYRASSPGADPFVEAGQRVVPGQVLCILEAMKLMNEITSEVAGTVVRVLPENGELVTLGADLFWIEP